MFVFPARLWHTITFQRSLEAWTFFCQTRGLYPRLISIEDFDVHGLLSGVLYFLLVLPTEVLEGEDVSGTSVLSERHLVGIFNYKFSLLYDVGVFFPVLVIDKQLFACANSKAKSRYGDFIIRSPFEILVYRVGEFFGIAPFKRLSNLTLLTHIPRI